MLRSSPAPRWRRALLAFAVGSSLTACQFPGTIAPPTTPAAAPGTAPAQYAPQSVPDEGQHKLTYDMKLVSSGSLLEAAPGQFRVQQTNTDCPPPLNPPQERITPNRASINGDMVDCAGKESWFTYYVVTEYPTYTLYKEWVHQELWTTCNESLSWVRYQSIDSPTAYWREWSCPKPTPGPSATPSPSPSPSAPPSVPPSVPPSEPPTPGPSPSVDPDPTPSHNPPTTPPATPSPTATPTPEPKLTIDHAAISPDGDGKEEDTPIHVEATGNWELDASGGELEGPVSITTGSGNSSITFSGKLANGEKLLDGTYTITLTEKSSGKKTRLPVKIESKLDLQVQYPAFSPNEPPDEHLPTNTLTITSNARWTLKATNIDTGSAAEVTGTRDRTFTWDGTTNFESSKGTHLPDGKYDLSVNVLDRAPIKREAIVDRQRPTVVIQDPTIGGLNPDGGSFTLKSGANISEAGLAGIEPNSIVSRIEPLNGVPSASIQNVQRAADGASVSFDIVVVSPQPQKAYQVASLERQGRFRLYVRAEDKVKNFHEPYAEFEVTFPPPGAARAGDNRGALSGIIGVKRSGSGETGTEQPNQPQPGPSTIPSPQPSGTPTIEPSPTPSTSIGPITLDFHIPECGPDNSSGNEEGAAGGYRIAVAESGPGYCPGEFTYEEKVMAGNVLREFGITVGPSAWDAMNSPIGQVVLFFVAPEVWAANKAAVSIKAVGGILLVQQNYKKGKLAEEAVRRHLSGNITDEQFFVRASEYGLRKNRFIDFVTPNSVIEVKNVQVLYASGQLKDLFNYARQRNLHPVIFTNAKIQSPTLKKLLMEYNVEVVEIPWYTMKGF